MAPNRFCLEAISVIHAIPLFSIVQNCGRPVAPKPRQLALLQEPTGPKLSTNNATVRKFQDHRDGETAGYLCVRHTGVRYGSFLI